MNSRPTTGVSTDYHLAWALSSQTAEQTLFTINRSEMEQQKETRWGALKITQEFCRVTPLTFNARVHTFNGQNMSNSAELGGFDKMTCSYKRKHNRKKRSP